MSDFATVTTIQAQPKSEGLPLRFVMEGAPGRQGEKNKTKH